MAIQRVPGGWQAPEPGQPQQGGPVWGQGAPAWQQGTQPPTGGGLYRQPGRQPKVKDPELA